MKRAIAWVAAGILDAAQSRPVMACREIIALRKARKAMERGHSTMALGVISRAYGRDRAMHVFNDVSRGWPAGTTERAHAGYFGPD